MTITVLGYYYYYYYYKPSVDLKASTKIFRDCLCKNISKCRFNLICYLSLGYCILKYFRVGGVHGGSLTGELSLSCA